MRVEQKLILPLILTIVGNSITAIIKNVGLLEWFLYAGVLILVIPILFIVKTNFEDKTVSYILLAFSILSISINDASVLNDIFFFIYSFSLFRQKKLTYIIYGSIYFSILTARYSFGEFIPSEIMVHLSGASFIIIIYQHYIHSKINKQDSPGITLESYYSPEVNNDVVDIIQNRCLGFDWPEINVKLELCIKDSEVPRKVRNEKNRLGFKTQDQFNLWLFEMGIIKPKTDKINMQA